MTDTQTVSDKDYSPLWFLQLGTNKLKTVKVNWGGECGCKFTPLHRSIYTYFGHIYFDDCSWYIINNNYYQNEITCSGSFNGTVVILVGWNSKAAATYQNLVSKFPSDITVRKKLGVSYLLMGQNEKARRVFSDVSLYFQKYLCLVYLIYFVWLNTPKS